MSSNPADISADDNTRDQVSSARTSEKPTFHWRLKKFVLVPFTQANFETKLIVSCGQSADISYRVQYKWVLIVTGNIAFSSI